MELQTLEKMCWGVVKKKLVGIPKKRNISFKRDEVMKRKKEEEERKRRQEEIMEAEGLRDALGWSYGERVKMVIKEEQWRYIHRDIVSTIM